MASRPKRYGRETPRLFTPPLRELTPDTSLGFSVIEFAETVLDVTLLPWQKWLVIHALELLEDGSLRFRTVLVLVARQNGKSTLSQVLALWWMYVCECALILGTAQDLETAEGVWTEVVEMAESIEDLAAEVKNVCRTNGKKSLDLLTGERYLVKAASRKAGRGKSADRVMLDELREHESWDSWAAIVKTTMARADAQVWCFSNAGDIRSVVLRHLRKMAHEAIGDPDGIVAAESDNGPSEVDVEAVEGDDIELDDFDVDADDLFLAEWSATPGCALDDRDEWAQANPSLGYTIAEKTIASAFRTDPAWVFGPEVLCQWTDGLLVGPFPAGTWEKTLNPTVEAVDGTVGLAPEHQLGGKLRFALDMSHDRSRVYIAMAGTREDGMLQGEVVAARYGTAWVKPWLIERRARILSITGQTMGAPVSALLDDLDKDKTFPIRVEPQRGGDLTGAFGIVHDLVRDGRVRHNPQPVLDLAVAGAAVKELGAGSVLDRRASNGDVSPLIAWVAAVWAATKPAPVMPPPKPAPQVVTATASPGSFEPSVADIGF